MDAGYRIKA